MKMTLKQVGDSIFGKELSQLAKDYPYQSFVVMSAALEFLGKCYSKRKKLQESGYSTKDCNDAVKSVSALKKYGKFNDLYHSLRC